MTITSEQKVLNNQRVVRIIKDGYVEMGNDVIPISQDSLLTRSRKREKGVLNTTHSQNPVVTTHTSLVPLELYTEKQGLIISFLIWIEGWENLNYPQYNLRLLYNIFRHRTESNSFLKPLLLTPYLRSNSVLTVSIDHKLDKRNDRCQKFIP